MMCPFEGPTRGGVREPEPLIGWCDGMAAVALKKALLGRVLELVDETDYERLDFLTDGRMVMATFGSRHGPRAAPALYCTYLSDRELLLEYTPGGRIYAIWSSIEIDPARVRASVKSSPHGLPAEKIYDFVPCES
jgi:hypothetical protein